MKPNAIYRLNGDKIPIFYEPILEKELDEIILSIKGIFAIKSEKGKLKFYNTENNLPNRFSFFNLNDLSFKNTTKFVGILVITYWGYKIASFKPKLPNVFKPGKTMEDLRKEMTKVKSPSTNTPGEPGSNVSSSPNGWTISNIN